jgi:hypothetical protein
MKTDTEDKYCLTKKRQGENTLISKYLYRIHGIICKGKYTDVWVELTNKCTIFLFYIYFHFFLDMFRHLHAILKGVHSTYIRLYCALTRDV